jgi:prepilin-type N-terminal cleavage/methylation domain-containing protein
MKMNRNAAATLIELLAVLVIIAILSTIAYVITTKVKSSAVAAQCSTRMLQWHRALELYRADYGNQNALSGWADYLGFPPGPPNHGILLAAPYLDPPREPRRRQTLYYASCVLTINDTGPILSLIYGFQPRDEGAYYIGAVSFLQLSQVMLGDTPVLFDTGHNPAGHNLENPRERHRVLWTTMDGRLNNKLITGIWADVLGEGFSDEQWLRWYDFEAWRRIRFGP